MADVNLSIAVGFDTQTTPGTFEAALEAVAGTVGLADGLVLGDAGSGIARSGIDFSTLPRRRAAPGIPGSRTKTDDFFVQEDLATLSVTFPIAGNRNTASGIPVGTGVQMLPHPGYQAILAAAGLIADTGTTEIATFAPGTPLPVSAMVWDSGIRSGVMDALVSTLTMQYAAGEVPLMTAEFAGAIAPTSQVARSLAFPTPTYGVVSSIPPKLVAGVGALWGGVSRCWQSLTITLDNRVSNVQDGCGVDGFRRVAGSPRVFGVAGTQIVNNADFDAEWDNMVKASTATDDMVFSIGSAASNGNAIEAHTVVLSNLRVLTHEVVEIDETGLRGISFTAECTAPTDGDEFSLSFF